MRWGMVAVFLSMSIPASAAEPPAEIPARTVVHLDYTARDPGCPREQFLQDVIRARTSYQPLVAAAPTRLVVTVKRDGRGYTARAVIRDASGAVLYARERGPRSDCQAIVEGLGFAISVALDPGGPAVTPPPQPPPPSAPKPPMIDQPAPVLPPPEASARRRVGAALAFGLGVAPRPAAGLAIDVGLRWPSFSLAVEGRVFPSAQGAADTGAVEIRTWQITGAVVPCGHRRWLFGCGIVEMGALSATSDARSPQMGTAFHFATGLRGGVEWQGWDHLALRASGEALVAPWRAALQIEDGARFTTPVVSGAFGAGFVASF
jgi:hypothetical protein